MKKWRRINDWLSVSEVTNEAAAEPAEILIYDRIGKDPYDESGVGAQDFNTALKAVPTGNPVLVRINSPGGNVWDGMAIYNMLKTRKGVTCQVDGIAASSASLIALGGDSLRMPKASLMMIHNPMDICYGNANDMRARADKLDQHKEAICSIYTDNSKLTKDQVMAAMDAETWMTGQQCKDCEMCDELTDETPVQNTFDLSIYRRVPEQIGKQKPTAPQNTGAQGKDTVVMNRNEMIALLQSRGVTVPDNCTDDWLKEQVKAPVAAAAPAAPAPAAPTSPAAATASDNAARLAAIEGQLAAERKTRITGVVNGLVQEFRITAEEAPKAIARAIADETYLDELKARPQVVPGNAPLNATVIADDVQNVFKAIRTHLGSGPGAVTNAAERSVAIGTIFRKERERIMPVLNAATNTVDSALKRVLILNETVRAFARRMLPIRAFATSFQNVPLAGTDEVVIPYYALQAAASSNFVEATGYVFDQATATSMKKITVNKRKYQPLDYSSAEFRRQPYLDVVRLGNLNSEKLAADIFDDIWSVVTLAAYGAAVKTAAAAAMTSDDVVDIAGACTKANWPTGGRSLILDSDTVTALMKDSAYKLASSIGGTEVVREGRLPRLSGFDVYEVPNLPSNSEKLQGAAVFMSAVLAAFAPVEPADGVRASLVAYEVATDAETGISMNYRKWGDAQLDRNFEVIECAYGYVAGVAAALKRICTP